MQSVTNSQTRTRVTGPEFIGKLSISCGVSGKQRSSF